MEMGGQEGVVKTRTSLSFDSDQAAEGFELLGCRKKVDVGRDGCWVVVQGWITRCSQEELEREGAENLVIAVPITAQLDGSEGWAEGRAVRWLGADWVLRVVFFAQFSGAWGQREEGQKGGRVGGDSWGGEQNTPPADMVAKRRGQEEVRRGLVMQAMTGLSAEEQMRVEGLQLGDVEAAEEQQRQEVMRAAVEGQLVREGEEQDSPIPFASN